MPKVDLSFMEDGVQNIQHYILILGIISVGTFVILTFLFRWLRVPRGLANLLTTLITVIVFVIVVLTIYLPGILETL